MRWSQKHKGFRGISMKAHSSMLRRLEREQQRLLRAKAEVDWELELLKKKRPELRLADIKVLAKPIR